MPNPINATPDEINVPIGDRAYSIRFASLLRADKHPLQDALQRYSAVQWLTNDTLANIYAPWLAAQVRASPGQNPPIVLPDGEAYKSWPSLESVLSAMLARKYDRKAALVAFGGGVMGDLGGLAGALYQRGIAVVQLPTTLLSMVDSSVGGKTAVNHPLGKNMIGAMHQPSAVWVDPDFLDTLPAREFSSGLAEVVKYGLLGSSDFLSWLNIHQNKIIARDQPTLHALIATSCQMKADIVVRDENEMGERALLNLGHTFGHAIESLTHYTQFLHGEAVARGMMMAARLSQLMGKISADDVTRLESLLLALGLPTRWVVAGEKESVRAERVHAMMSAMSHDKKVQKGVWRLIVLEKIGQATVTTQASAEHIALAINEFLAERL